MLRIACAVVLAALLAACGGDPAAAPRSPAGPSGEVLAGLCSLRGIDDVAVANERFLAGPHGPLHTLARTLEDADERVAAARLLEAKQQVESGLTAEPPPGDLPERLDALIGRTRAALETLGRPAPPCPDPTAPTATAPTATVP